MEFKDCKKVWYDELLWDVVENIEIDVKQGYLLVKRTEDENYIVMELIDTHNEIVYPDTIKVRELIDGIVKIEKQSNKIKEELCGIWLGMFKEK